MKNIVGNSRKKSKSQSKSKSKSKSEKKENKNIEKSQVQKKVVKFVDEVEKKQQQKSLFDRNNQEIEENTVPQTKSKSKKKGVSKEKRDKKVDNIQVIVNQKAE